MVKEERKHYNENDLKIYKVSNTQIHYSCATTCSWQAWVHSSCVSF